MEGWKLSPFLGELMHGNLEREDRLDPSWNRGTMRMKAGRFFYHNTYTFMVAK